MRGAYEVCREKCPYCGEECECEYVDVGVGLQQVTPFECARCHAVQIGPFDGAYDPSKPHDKDFNDHGGRALSEREVKTGWYEPC